MDTQFAWFLDAATIGIIVVALYIGGKRGFMKGATLLLGYVISLVGGFVISGAVAPVVYEKLVQTKAQNTIKENISSFDVKSQIKDSLKKKGIDVEIPDAELDKIINSGTDISTGIEAYVKKNGSNTNQTNLKNDIDNALNIDKLLGSVKNEKFKSVIDISKNSISNSKDSLQKTIVILNNPDKQEAAVELEKSYIRPAITAVIRLIILLITFVILSIVVKIIAGLFSKVNAIPVAGSLNVIAGAGLGLVQGVFIVVLLSVLIKIVIALTTNNLMVFNEPTINETNIFKFFYDMKL